MTKNIFRVEPANNRCRLRRRRQLQNNTKVTDAQHKFRLTFRHKQVLRCLQTGMTTDVISLVGLPKPVHR